MLDTTADQATTDQATAEVITLKPTSANGVSRIPGEQGRPCFVVLDEFTEEGASKYRAGVWHFGIKPGRGDDAPPTLTQRWVCNAEQGQIAERLHSFIDRHGDSRFSDADSEDDQRAAMVRDRAGWWQDGHEGRVYWFTADGLREALKGFDFARALDVLQLQGLIPAPGADGKRARFKRIRGRGMKLYAVHPEGVNGGISEVSA